jgi:hypothetical protein
LAEGVGSLLQRGFALGVVLGEGSEAGSGFGGLAGGSGDLKIVQRILASWLAGTLHPPPKGTAPMPTVAMPTFSTDSQPFRSSAWAFVALFVLLAMLAVSPITSQAVASTTRCSGSVYSHSGGTTYKVTSLAVTNTTCAVGKKLSSKIPAYRVPKPIHVEGFLCTATRYYSSPQLPQAGGYEKYVCHKQSKLVTWNLEVPSEI